MSSDSLVANALDISENLAAIVEAIKDARIVMLGEQSHGDGAAFNLKVELIKYLHLNAGFNVLAFESDFFGLEYGWQNAATAADSLNLAKWNIYPIWSQVKELEPLWDFVQARFTSERPLVLTGVDTRPSRQTVKVLPEQLAEFLGRHVPDRLETDAYRAFAVLLKDMLRLEYSHKVNSKDRDLFRDFIFDTLRALKGKTGEDLSFWRQTLRNLLGCARNAWASEYRDRAMADNLLWLAQEGYARERVIVWAHNYHVLKDAEVSAAYSDWTRKEKATHPDPQQSTQMGVYVAEALAAEVYSLGFVSYQGDYDFFGKPSKIARAPEGSLEAKLHRADFKKAFVDLRAAPEAAFSASGVEHNSYLNWQWSNVYDGFIFIDEMVPPAALEPV